MRFGFVIAFLLLMTTSSFAAPVSTRATINFPTYCNDRDGKNFTTFDYARSNDGVRFDSCQSPLGMEEQPSGFVKKWLTKFRHLFRSSERRQNLDELLSPGEHNGEYQTMLNEAVCDGKKTISFAHNCADENMSCVLGRCEMPGCEQIASSNKALYKGFLAGRNGYLEDSPEVARPIAACQDNVTLVTHACAKVPDGKYITLRSIIDQQIFVANQGEDYLARNQETCYGRDIPLPCQPDIPGMSPITVSGCVNKEKLIAALVGHAGTGNAIIQIEESPDFAYCAEDMSQDCTDEGYAGNSPVGHHGDSASSGGGGTGETGGAGTGGSGEGSGGESGGGIAVTGTTCLPLDGSEQGNSCVPRTNGIKIVDVQHPEVPIVIHCSYCESSTTMKQWLCTHIGTAPNATEDSKTINCGVQKCDEGLQRCTNCASSSTTWCGE